MILVTHSLDLIFATPLHVSTIEVSKLKQLISFINVDYHPLIVIIANYLIEVKQWLCLNQ